ncbi:GntR family transcriptional regulator [Salipiger abyssi]|uniref:GntR family transcriptional regulator n=1 Tax=Salipiger abyssi TaxID=1250539 RepID=UPI001A90C83E|nr:GntR family transcriptional regulator [Salipiger abyssi]MBN9885851.1 GntR family transcriptional regulator [Salipiger abyssi]
MSKDANAALKSNRISSAQRAYQGMREQLLRFEIHPGQKINEVTMAARLETSRTPLREALSRMVAEGLLVTGDRGFAVPDLEPETVQGLFEARLELECSMARLACERATPEALAALSEFLTESAAESPNASVDRLMELDIKFHDSIAAMSGNEALRAMLANVNDRIYLVRWIAMEGRRNSTQAQHREILECVMRGDKQGASEVMRNHIMHRNDEILAAIKSAYGHVFTMGSN